MQLIKCDSGHIYDKDKFRSCPHCSNIVLETTLMDITTGSQEQADTEIPELSLQNNYERISRRKTVGMLLCTQGDMKGDGFFLKEGENVIGRASNMDVALTQEVSISRKKHAVIYYDDNDLSFTLKVINTKTEVFCNGKSVTECTLKNNDELVIGQCKLVFINVANLW